MKISPKFKLLLEVLGGLGAIAGVLAWVAPDFFKRTPEVVASIRPNQEVSSGMPYVVQSGSTNSNQNISINNSGGAVNVQAQNTININNSPAVSVQEKADENLLEKVNTGVTAEYIKSVFGIPQIEDEHEKIGIVDAVYVYDKFYLQFLFKNGKVIFYSVTSRRSDFQPVIPKTGERLGGAEFSKFNMTDVLVSYLGSKYFMYVEYDYLGNPGNYRNLYLAHHPSGINFGKRDFPMFFSEKDRAAVSEFRARAIPNTYGVGDILGSEEEIIKEIGIGIDYFKARDFP